MTEKAQATENGEAQADGNDSLTVTDNRTGESYDIEITAGTVRAIPALWALVNISARKGASSATSR